ncbi:MAG: hypothetical protein V3T26_05935 [candidate division NC10 bacterium]
MASRSTVRRKARRKASRDVKRAVLRVEAVRVAHHDGDVEALTDAGAYTPPTGPGRSCVRPPSKPNSADRRSRLEGTARRQAWGESPDTRYQPDRAWSARTVDGGRSGAVGTFLDAAPSSAGVPVYRQTAARGAGKLAFHLGFKEIAANGTLGMRSAGDRNPFSEHTAQGLTFDPVAVDLARCESTTADDGQRHRVSTPETTDHIGGPAGRHIVANEDTRV